MTRVRSIHPARSVLLACSCLLTSCVVAEPADESDDPNDSLDAASVGDVAVGVPIKNRRSLVVTSPDGISGVERDYPLGKLLAAVGRHTIREAISRGSEHAFDLDEIDAWVRHPFERSRGGFTVHSGKRPIERVGVATEHNPYANLLDNWPGVRSMPVSQGPFRLLAVVNRMDLAGDFDARGNLAARDPKALGEGRLVFGLVDPEYEARHGKPYPMTLIIEYRLPPITEALEIDTDFDIRRDMFDRPRWRTQMSRWGTAWRALSQWDPNSTDPAERRAFSQHLGKLVALIARPENFLALRSNVELEAADGRVEYEMREWYILLGDRWTLIPRHLRDEPYQCGDDVDIAAIVNWYWDDANGDLDFVRTLREINQKDQKNSGGYHIPRPNFQSPVAISNPIAGCPTDPAGNPLKHAMAGDGNDPAGTTTLLTPFARLKENRVWRLPGVDEERRHAFAVRTCSGCHGKETGEFGFHIFPRMADRPSRLSKFLSGTDDGAPQFSRGGVDYRYSELEVRRQWLRLASERRPELELYDSLYRHDAQ